MVSLETIATFEGSEKGPVGNMVLKLVVGFVVGFKPVVLVEDAWEATTKPPIPTTDCGEADMLLFDLADAVQRNFTHLLGCHVSQGNQLAGIQAEPGIREDSPV